MVMPEVVTGRPAFTAEVRAILCPVEPSGSPQPNTTSSTSVGSTPARSTAFLMTCAPRVAPLVLFRLPRKALPIPVRADDTITASRIRMPPFALVLIVGFAQPI